jgi:sortase A
MRKIVLIIILISIALGVFVGRSLFSPATESIVSPKGTSLGAKDTVTTSEQKVAEPGLPVRLSIPKIGVNAAVEYVGMDAKGNMDVPKKDENVAWYQPGFRPGSVGNAVLAGHLDTRAGTPAVFYELSSLIPGDKIIVTDDQGQTHTFVVTKKEKYPFDSFPLQEVFGPFEKARLNLITCEGVFSSAQRTYSHRTVVYSELQ